MIHNREIIRINGEAFRLGNFEVNDEMNFGDDKPMINEINNRIQANLKISWKNIEKNSDYKYTSDRFKNRFDNLKANLKVIEIKGVWHFHQRYFLGNGVEEEVSSDSNSDDEAQLQSVSIQESEPPKIKNVSTPTDAINPNSSCLDQSVSNDESSDDNATLADFGDLDVDVEAAVKVGIRAALRTGIIAALQSIDTTQSRFEVNSGNHRIHNNSIQDDSLAFQVEESVVESESESDSDASMIKHTQSLDDEDETEPIATPNTSNSEKNQLVPLTIVQSLVDAESLDTN